MLKMTLCALFIAGGGEVRVTDRARTNEEARRAADASAGKPSLEVG